MYAVSCSCMRSNRSSGLPPLVAPGRAQLASMSDRVSAACEAREKMKKRRISLELCVHGAYCHPRGLPSAGSAATRGVYHLPGLLPHHSSNQQPPTSAWPTATRGVYRHIPATTSTHHHSLKPSRTVARPLHHRDASFSPTLTVTVVLPMLQAVRCLSCGV